MVKYANKRLINKYKKLLKTPEMQMVIASHYENEKFAYEKDATTSKFYENEIKYWCEKSANQDYAPAQVYLGSIFCRRSFIEEDDGVKKNSLLQCIVWLKKGFKQKLCSFDIESLDRHKRAYFYARNTLPHCLCKRADILSEIDEWEKIYDEEKKLGFIETLWFKCKLLLGISKASGEQYIQSVDDETIAKITSVKISSI